ncbi:zinc-ribbon and DUF3426 domain-containing protein [Variovorax paradoxus]|nr:zinc-ribbon and DUF3426 domain-containing protein [Variovorax paradoxus]MBT2302655.1 zinc-ribbon and DUF3426 domain-containing protein [Variovorax paradoxus]
MSLVTRCPACATTFKVVKDQLRISDGWVRCGRCSEVFDATVDLHEAPDAAPGPAAVAPTSAAGEGTSVPPAADPPIEIELDEVAEPPADEEPVRNLEEADFLDDEQETEPPLAEPPVAAPPPPPPPPAPKTSASSDALSLAVGVVADEPWPQRSQPMRATEAQVVPPYPSLPPFPNIDLNLPAAPPIGREPPPPRPSPPPPPAAEDDTGNAQLQKALRRARAKSAKIARAKARGEERAARESAPVVLAASEPEPAVEPARRSARFSGGGAEGSAFWQRPAVRRSLIAAAALAALLLLVQVLHQERDLIAARQPALRPALAALCSLTGCELSALRQIGDITIDGASFAREKSGDAYRLSFTLRNAATVPLAMPAVELSLLDMQERAVIRRVLMPAEFGAPTVLPARAERAASLPLALTGPEAAALPPITGYRVLAFYP